MITVTATLSFSSQGDRDAAVAASAPVQQATRSDEAGCLLYCFAADPCVSTEIQVVELWTDADCLAAHFDHPNYGAMVAALRDAGVTGSENRLYLSDDRGTVYDEAGAFRRDALTP